MKPRFFCAIVWLDMKGLVPKIILAVMAAGVAAYVIDYVSLRLRMSGDSSRAFDTVQVEVVDVIPHKGNKAEYVPEAPQGVTCVRSLFPHLGDTPCWYLRRHAQQQVNF